MKKNDKRTEQDTCIDQKLEDIAKLSGFWTTKGPLCDTVLSSRIRLARNMHSVSFPHLLKENDLAKIENALLEFSENSEFSDNTVIRLKDLNSRDKRYLRERNIITYEMEISETSHILVNMKNDFSIMVNEEDHFRIQVIRPGLQLMDSYRIADRVDDELNRFIEYAYSKEYGYISACPSNLGTGLKASVILHLPLISMKKEISGLVDAVKQSGIEIKGTLGEGNKTLGSLYQVSNRVSMGASEIDIIELTDGIINRIILMEDNLREEILSTSKAELEDRIWRIFGQLKYARRISYREALEFLSDIRLGIILGFMGNTKLTDVNDLMVNIQWFHLQRNAGHAFNNSVECDEYRADFIKNYRIFTENRNV